MIDLLELQKVFILNHLKAGDTAVDFTMGNGHDTEFLSKTVGEHGRVFAFDIQPDALSSTQKRLTEENCPKNYTLIHDSHHKVKKYVMTPIKAGMFNLGYLPGGDKSITTMRKTTLPAVSEAISLLGADSILLVAVYPGHAEGKAEGEEIEKFLSLTDRRKICVAKIKIVNSPSSPYFFTIETK